MRSRPCWDAGEFAQGRKVLESSFCLWVVLVEGEWLSTRLASCSAGAEQRGAFVGWHRGLEGEDSVWFISSELGTAWCWVLHVGTLQPEMWRFWVALGALLYY